MNTNKIRIGITEGDINGIGYEVILKAFGTSEIFDLCVPIIYGSPKVATYHSKAINSTTNFSIVRSALEAKDGCLNVINCNSNEVVVALGTPDPLAGVAAFEALECAVEDYKQGLIDVIVTAPINKHSIQSDQFSFVGHTEYFENRLGNGAKALMILLKDDFRIALVTTHIPISRISSVLTKELIEEKLTIFNTSLKQDFSIDAPRIAVLSLNPHAGEDGLIGKEEQDIIIPALVEMKNKGVLCYGPYPVDGFMG
ncbi:MAG: 4-hydroxythreonine-4-phosphate dehydrogenase PdxA, partial [Bacteroidaceae bacterium]